MSIKKIGVKSLTNSICFIGILSLSLIITLSPGTTYGKEHKVQGKKNVVKAMTVAAIRPAGKDENFVTVILLESSRFYKLPKNADPGYLEVLKDAQKNKYKVLISRASEQSDVILSVKKQK